MNASHLIDDGLGDTAERHHTGFSVLHHIRRNNEYTSDEFRDLLFPFPFQSAHLSFSATGLDFE
jgi:hypothetical protein